MDVALATCRVLPEPDPDESLLVAALAQQGLSVACLPWDDPCAPFWSASLTVLRSTWNYHHHRETFLRWVDGLGGRVANPPGVVRWNSHKSYLLELAQAGVRTVPTALLARGATVSLDRVLASRGWVDAVVKPAVSAASFETKRVTREQVDAEHQAWLDRLLADRDMLVQPYVASVEDWGERAVVIIDGHVSHAVRKTPRFAGQQECVSAAVKVEPDEQCLAELALAAGMRRTGAERLLYARVDTARDADGAPMVMELELVEPSLFLAQNPASIALFAAAIARWAKG
jgi:glutathione synthase/RimK-type ligase-like ATP-grasp enzyme